MANLTYPSTVTLTKIANDLIPAMTMDDPIFELFPLTQHESWTLRWEVENNFPGLMKLRGLGGEPTPIKNIGSNIYEAEPGAYGQVATIDEEELTRRAAMWSVGSVGRIPINTIIAEKQARLLQLQVTRARQLSWAMALAGTFSVNLPNGGVGHTATVTMQTDTVNPLWSSTTTAHPLLDVLGLQTTYGRGSSTSFMAGAELWMNSRMANYLILNTLATDLGGRLVGGGNTINDLAGINSILTARNSPTIRTFDDGYLNDAGSFTLFLPDNKVLVVGRRPNGEAPGEFQMCYNAISGTTGAYTQVIDKTKDNVPPGIQVHGGFNGGPVLKRPTQLVVLTVASL